MSVIAKDKFSEMFMLIEKKSSEVRDKINVEQAKADEDMSAKLYMVHTYGSKYSEDFQALADLVRAMNMRGVNVSCDCLLLDSDGHFKIFYNDEVIDAEVDARRGVAFIDDETNMFICVYTRKDDNDFRCCFDITFLDDNITAKFLPTIEDGVKTYMFDGFTQNGTHISRYSLPEYWHKMWYTFGKVQDVTPTFLLAFNDAFNQTLNKYANKVSAANNEMLRVVKQRVASILTVPEAFNKKRLQTTLPDDFDVRVISQHKLENLSMDSSEYHIGALKPKAVKSVYEPVATNVVNKVSKRVVSGHNEAHTPARKVTPTQSAPVKENVEIAHQTDSDLFDDVNIYSHSEDKRKHIDMLQISEPIGGNKQDLVLE